MCFENILVLFVVVVVLIKPFVFGHEHVPDAGQYHFDQMALFHGIIGDHVRREELHTDVNETRWNITRFRKRFIDQRLNNDAVET